MADVRNLLVVPRPGDEVVLYGMLVWKSPETEWHALLVCDDCGLSSAWNESVGALGISQVKRLDFPFFPISRTSPTDLTAALRPHVNLYDKVYAPDATSEGFDGTVTAALASTGIPSIMTRTANGSPDEVLVAAPSDWNRIRSHLNSFYGTLIRRHRLALGDLSPVCTYRHVACSAIRRWNDVTHWSEAVQSDDDDPWDLLSSEYERKRHSIELQAISALDWDDMVEIGACVGAFTRLALDRFPSRRLTAVEPVAAFADKLAIRTGRRIRIIVAPAHTVDEAFDLVFISSATYFMPAWPYALISKARRHVVTSHRTEYEEQVIVPAMQSSGWVRVESKLLEPCFEEFCGFTLDRDGTTVSTWSTVSSR